MNFLPDVIALMADDARLVSDNIFHDGDVFGIPLCGTAQRSYDTWTYAGIFTSLCENEELETICLPRLAMA